MFRACQDSAFLENKSQFKLNPLMESIYLK